MELRFCLLTSLMSMGLLLGAVEAAQAQLSGVNTEGFEQIEQPIALNTAVTAAGLGLMGLELWWFLLSRPKAKSEQGTAVELAVIPEVLSNGTAGEAMTLEATSIGELIEDATDRALVHESDRADVPTIAVETIAEDITIPVPALVNTTSAATLNLKRAIEALLSVESGELCDRITTNIRAACDGIQMPRGVLVVEDRMGPRFSAASG